MLSACAGDTSRKNLASLGNKLLQLSCVLVIYILKLFICAESANLFSSTWCTTAVSSVATIFLECHFDLLPSTLKERNVSLYGSLDIDEIIIHLG